MKVNAAASLEVVRGSEPPAHDVFDVLVSTIVQLSFVEAVVGESASLSSDNQAQLLGEAWESAGNTESLRL
jgi:hypothetical protein